MAQEIKVEYDGLEQVVSRFANQSQAVRQTIQMVMSHLDRLENGGWIGLGAESFFDEMHGQILPSTQRLQDALDEAGRVTRQVAGMYRQAEEESVPLFQNS